MKISKKKEKTAKLEKSKAIKKDKKKSKKAEWLPRQTNLLIKINSLSHLIFN